MPPRHKKRRKNQAAAAAVTKRRDWLVGDLVVAKLRGHRPWPAQIQRPEDYGYEARPHKIFVTFFGTEETCFCTHNKITPFTSAMRKSMAEQLQKINTNPELERAIKEIFAADDELKVSMKSQNKSDDEKSDEEDEQPPEASSKPPPRKKAKIAPQEDTVVQEPAVHSMGKESRPTRAGGGGAAANTPTQSAKQERAIGGGSSVKSMAAHQVQKLPRKVRIKVSSQSSDSANHQSVGEATEAVTDQASLSPQSQKSEAESPSRSETEKKVDNTSSPAPNSTAAEAECSKNGDVEMEEATAEANTVDGEVTKKGGEQASTDAAEDEECSKRCEVDSAKIEVHGDKEVIGGPVGTPKGSGMEDNENYEITAVKMETDTPSKVETEAGVAIETDEEAKTEITTSPVDICHVEKQGSVAEDKEEKGDGAGRAADAGVADPKMAVAEETVEEKCMPTRVEKAEGKVQDCGVQSDERIEHCDSTSIAMVEEKICKSAAVATEVKDRASTVEETAERKDCEPVDSVKVEKCVDSSVETRNEGNVSNSTIEPMQVDTTCESAVAKREGEPSGESTAIDQDAEQSCEEKASAEKIHISCEPSESAEEEMKVVCQELPREEVRDGEVPAVAKENLSNFQSPAIAADEDKDCTTQANLEEVKDCNHPLDEFEASSVAMKQEKAGENAAPVGPTVGEAAKDKDREVLLSKEEEYCHSTHFVDTQEDSGVRSMPRLREEPQNLESTRSEKPVENESETTIMPTGIGVVEKDQEKEEEKDGAKVNVTVDDDCDGISVDKEKKLPGSVVEDGDIKKIAAAATEHDRSHKDEGAPAAEQPTQDLLNVKESNM